MSSVNRVILIGRVGKDPEIKSFSNGGEIANFSLATSERWTDKNSGEKREKTEWSNITVSGPLVKVAKEYVKKGDQLYISGKLQTRKWQDQSGQDRFITEVSVGGFGGELVMLGSKKDGSKEAAQSQTSDEPNWDDELNDTVPF